LRSNKKGYGGKTHETGSQNSDTTAPGDRELYHLQFSLKAVSPETSGYTIACVYDLLHTYLFLIHKELNLSHSALYNFNNEQNDAK
jgi:hypothetical protein